MTSTKIGKRVMSARKLTPTQESQWARRSQLAQEIARAKATLQKLENERKAIDESIVPLFLADDSEVEGQRRLSSGVVIVCNRIIIEDKVCTPDMVGTVLRKGYSYTQFKEADA